MGYARNGGANLEQSSVLFHDLNNNSNNGGEFPINNSAGGKVEMSSGPQHVVVGSEHEEEDEFTLEDILLDSDKQRHGHNNSNNNDSSSSLLFQDSSTNLSYKWQDDSVDSFRYQSEDDDEEDYLTGPLADNNMESYYGKKANRRVQFSVVQVREYAITVGDHPGRHCPLTLSWEYTPQITVDLECHEERRINREFKDEACSSGGSIATLNVHQRRNRLAAVLGSSQVVQKLEVAAARKRLIEELDQLLELYRKEQQQQQEDGSEQEGEDDSIHDSDDDDISESSSIDSMSESCCSYSSSTGSSNFFLDEEDELTINMIEGILASRGC